DAWIRCARHGGVRDWILLSRHRSRLNLHSTRTTQRMGKTLVVIGLVISGLGLLMMLGVPFFRLPGDFYVKRGSFSFYFPLSTSILLSIILTLLMALFRR